MNKKYIILTTIVTLLIVGIVGIFILFKNSKVIDSRVTYDSNIVKEAKSTTSLIFTPASIDVSNGQIFSSNVNILTDNIVTGVDIELVYNPAIIQIDKIIPFSLVDNFTNSANWQIIKNEINNKEGNARFIAFTTDSNFGISGETEILEVKGTAKEFSDDFESYQIDFGQLTVISALNMGYNVLTQKSPLILNFLKI